MNRSIAITLILGSLVIGGVGGYVAGGQPVIAQNPDEESTPSLEDQLLDVAPRAAMLFDTGTLRPIATEFADWSYPDGVSLERGHLVETTASDASGVIARTKLGARDMVFTADDFGTVVDHYVRQMKGLLPSGGTDAGEQSVDNGVVLMIEGAGVDQYRQARSLEIATLSLQAANCNVTLAISRGTDEDASYIHLIYNEWPVSDRE